MPNNVRDAGWQYWRPIVQTRKNNKVITVDAFSANCGPRNNVLYANNYFTNNSGGLNLGASTVDNLDLSNAFTLECLVKPGRDFDRQKQTLITFNPDYPSGFLNTYSLQLSIFERKLLLEVFVGGVLHTLTSDDSVHIGRWNHVAATFDGQTFKLFINQVKTTLTLVISGSGILGEGDGLAILGEGSGEIILGEGGGGSNTLDISQGFTSNEICGNMASITPFYGWMDELRIWDVCRTEQQIAEAAYTSRDTSGTIDIGLKRYYKFNEVELNATTVNAIDGHIVNTDTIYFPGSFTIYDTANDDEPSPAVLKFGASFIPYQVTCVADSPFSLKYPIVPEDDVDHCLCVSWIDDDGIFQRRKLYGNVGEDINPDPEDYNGERISDNFILEFWNIDGNETINLVDDLIIYTSHTSNPATGIDHAHSSDATTSGSSALAAPFPWVFPITFNTQQTY